MKTQIRRGVFETNSSSSHSLQLVPGGYDENVRRTLQEIISMYIGCLSPERDDEYYAKWYIDGNKMMIEGIEVSDSEEDKCVACIVSNWFMKIQFMANIIYSTIDNTWMYDGLTEEFAKKNELWVKFAELCVSYSKKKGYNIDDIIIKDKVRSIWWDNNEFDLTIENIEDKFKKIMNDDFSIIYTDYAYHPSGRPEIETY